MEYAELHELFLSQREEMTQAQRAAAYAQGEVVDYNPYSIQSNEEALAVAYGYTIAQTLDGVDAMVDVLKRRECDFGITGIKVGLRLRTVGEAVGSELFYPEVGIDRVTKHVLGDWSDFAQLIKNDPYKNPLYKGLIERCKRLKDALPDHPVNTTVAGPFSTAAAIRPVDLLLRDTRKHKAELVDLLKFCNEHVLAWVDMMVAEFGPIACGVCDPVTCADILSESQYLELSEPRLTEVVDGIVELTGRKPGMHICGKTNPFWSHMKKLNCASFSVDNKEDLSDAKDQMGDTFALVGNVDPVNVMLKGSIDDVVEACKSCLEKAADSPLGYTLGTGCQVPIGTPLQNFEAFVYAARKYGAGAQKGHMPAGLQAC